MKVTFSRRARRELDDIFDDVLQRASPRTALRLVDRLEARCKSLEMFPERGTSYSHPRLRHLRRIVEAPFVIVYEVDRQTVRTLTILHGRRDVESQLIRTVSSG